MKKITKPQRVDFLVNVHDFRVAVMGNLGFSNAAIQEETGFTQCQVSYHLHKSSTRISDYRNGNSESAGLVLSKMERIVAEQVRAQLIKTSSHKKVG